MIRDVPNLELIIYIAEEGFTKDLECMDKYYKYKIDYNDKHPDFKYCPRPEFIVDSVFLQMWGSTSLGFGGIGGCAMTEAYTTVVRERLTDTYIVFFDNRPCYLVCNPSEEFFEDLKNRNMVSLAEAKKRY